MFLAKSSDGGRTVKMEAVEDGGRMGEANACDEIGDVGLRRFTRFTDATFPF